MVLKKIAGEYCSHQVLMDSVLVNSIGVMEDEADVDIELVCWRILASKQMKPSLHVDPGNHAPISHPATDKDILNEVVGKLKDIGF